MVKFLHFLVESANDVLHCTRTLLRSCMSISENRHRGQLFNVHRGTSED
jgi:hypothetical protein